MRTITIFRLAQRDFEVSWSEIKMFLTLLFNKLTSFLHYTFIDKEKILFQNIWTHFSPSHLLFKKFILMKKLLQIFFIARIFFNHDFFLLKWWEIIFGTIDEFKCQSKNLPSLDIIKLFILSTVINALNFHLKLLSNIDHLKLNKNPIIINDI